MGQSAVAGGAAPLHRLCVVCRGLMGRSLVCVRVCVAAPARRGGAAHHDIATGLESLTSNIACFGSCTAWVRALKRREKDQCTVHSVHVGLSACLHGLR